jgi:hypothetical protein
LVNDWYTIHWSYHASSPHSKAKINNRQGIYFAIENNCCIK